MADEEEGEVEVVAAEEEMAGAAVAPRQPSTGGPVQKSGANHKKAA